MPRLPIDYSKTIIYKIVCKDLTIKNCYVGHTTDFPNRKRTHKCRCKTSDRCVYKFIREHGGWDKWDMIMVEQCQCTNLYEACARERYWMEELNADLNQLTPATGLAKSEYKKQYAIQNAEIIAEKRKQYDIINKDRQQEYHKQYYIQNAERIKNHVCCILCAKQMAFSSLNPHYKLKH
jgi:hypothetical protein